MHTKIRKTLNYLIRITIILVTYGFIYRQVFRQHRPDEVILKVTTLLDRRETWYLMALILLMMLVNWGLESRKWQLLIGKIEIIGFLNAFKAVLTGVSISLFTPNRTGDYLGRVFILEKGNHVEGIMATIVGSFAQLLVTISVGLFCLLSFLDQYLRVSHTVHEYLLTGLIFLVPVVVFFLLLAYFRIGMLTNISGRNLKGRWQKITDYTAVFSKFTTRELLVTLLLSLARYLVFSIQLFILLRVFGVNIPPGQGFILIPVIYLIMAGVPSVALADLGIRGSVSLYIFGLYFDRYGIAGTDHDLGILTASTLLWFTNLIIPAIMGTFFVFNLKFFRK